MQKDSPETRAAGKVYLIGAGPGDPGLLTLRGLQLLRKADVVLYDFLANPRLLEHARGDAILQCVGKHGLGPDAKTKIWSQPEINARMLALAKDGRMVVRLKGGDPSIFARAGEEIDALQAAGISFEIVPGITSALAAAAFAAAPLTQRDQASAVALLTGRECDGKNRSSLDFEALARFPGALAIYMGVVTVSHWSKSLLDAGKPGETPCSIIRRCSLPDQLTLHCRLDEVEQIVRRDRIRPPAVFLIGDLTRNEAVNWFENRPLFGFRIVVTRPREKAAEIADLLSELGAQVIIQPAIEIRRQVGDGLQRLDHALKNLARFDWIVFSSGNGVHHFFERLTELELDARALANVRIAAVGTATAAALQQSGLRADFVAAQADQDGLAHELESHNDCKFLLIRGSRGRDVLAERLTEIGAEVEQVSAYESRDVTEIESAALAELRRAPVDWVIAASSASARSAHRLLGALAGQANWVAISSLTADALHEIGIDCAAVAKSPSAQCIVDAIVEVAADARRTP